MRMSTVFYQKHSQTIIFVQIYNFYLFDLYVFTINRLTYIIFGCIDVLRLLLPETQKIRRKHFALDGLSFFVSDAPCIIFRHSFTFPPFSGNKKAPRRVLSLLFCFTCLFSPYGHKKTAYIGKRLIAL